jgi:UDP-N-acetylglucosamine 2-epimerase
VLVYGDTNSTIAGALSARQLGLKVIHYEAGVRNLDPKMPEEINRIVVDRISDILFCVSDTCVSNLENESLWFDRKVFKTGDLMYDCFLRDTQKDRGKANYVYVTIHRADNTDNKENLQNIVITDSGGVVKEAYWSKKISMLLMERPVWPELVALDSCVNVKSDYDEILNTYGELINMKPVFDSDVYGVGDASKKIAKILCQN